MRFAVVDKTTWTVRDVVMLDEELPEDEGTVYVATATANIGYTYDVQTKAFQMPYARTTDVLEDYRAQKMEELSEYLHFAENMGMQYDGNWFSTDPNSQVKLLAIMMSATMDPTFTTVFKTLNHDYVHLQLTDITGLCNASKTYIATCYQVDSMYTQAIKKASSIEELDAIELSQKWPNGPIDLSADQSTKA